MTTTKSENDFKGVRDNARTNASLKEMHQYFNELTVNDRQQVNELRKRIEKKKTRKILTVTSQIYNKLKQKTKINKVFCDSYEDFVDDYVYNSLRDSSKIYKLPNCKINRRYVYKNEVFSDPTLKYIHPKDLPAEVINQYRFGYSHFHTTQLGVGYSSNSAGDGPPFNHRAVQIIDIERFSDDGNIKIETIILECPIKISHIIHISNTILSRYEGNVAEPEKYFQYVLTTNRKMLLKVDLEFYFKQKKSNQKHKEEMEILDHAFHTIYTLLIIIIVWITIQLGVAYSSNNAGDGPGINLEPFKSLIKAHFKEPRACHVAETLVLFIYDLSRSKTKTDMLISVGRFMREHYKGQLLEDAIVQIKDCINVLFSPAQLQSDDENIFEIFRNYLDDFDAVKQSGLYKKCYKLIMYILSFTLFRDKNCTYESFGYTAMEAAAMRLRYHAGPDMIYTILDTITFIGEKGYDIYRQGFSVGMLQTSSKYEKFINQCREVKEIAQNMSQAEILDESALLNRVEELLAQGEDILRCKQMLGRVELAYITKYVSEIRSIKLEILSFRGATRARKAPFAILFYGNSGIGKSTILKTTIAATCNKMNLPNEDAFIYTRNSVEEFWNNFRTYMHTLILDDVAFRNPDMKDSSSVDEIIQIVNDINFVPNQASLEDKGRIPFRCKNVFATTNTLSLNAYNYFSFPSAIQRRFPYVVVPTVKCEYQNPETKMLDPTLVPIVQDNEFPDYWNFKIMLVTPAPIREGSKQAMATYTTLHECLDMEGYIDWLYQAIEKHEKNTTTVQDSLAQIRTVKTCELCKKPKKYCKCLQSATMAVLRFGYWYAWWTVTQEAVYAFFVLLLTNVTPVQYAASVLGRYTNNPVIARIMFDRMSAQVKAKLNKPELLIYFTGVAGALLLLWKTYKSFESDLQGANQSKYDEEGKKPIPRKCDDTENVWYKNDFELTTADVTRTILSSKSLPFENLVNIFSKNCVALKFDISNSTYRNCKAFAVTGQLYLTNNHCVPENDGVEVSLTQQSSKEGVNSNIAFTLSQTDVIRMPDKDLCLIVVRCLPPRKNLVEYFPLDTFEANTHGIYLSRNTNGSICREKVLNVKLVKRAGIAVLNKSFDVWQGISTTTKNGDCGSLLISQSSYGTCITGIHILGHEDKVVATRVSREDILGMIAKVDKFAVSSNPPLLQSENEDRKLTKLHPKSVYRYIEKGSVNVYGSILGFRPTHKTRVENTPMKECVEKEFGVTVTEVAPDMSYKPWRAAALDLTNIPNNIDTNVLDLCVKNFASDITEKLSREDNDDLHIYDQFTSVNGAMGVRFVDKINRNTSAGFPFKKSKKYYIEGIPADHGLLDPVKVNDEIQQQIDTMTERLKHYEMTGCVFNAHLKDEPVSAKKKAIGKTRVFAGANFPWTVITRKYLLSFVRILQNNNMLFETAIGVNHFSSEWENFYNYLTHFGTGNCIAGDYSKFDKRMSPVFILSAYDFISIILKNSGNFDEEDLRIIRCLAYDTAFAYQDYNGDLVQFFGGNPSGHSLTVIINGIVNSLYMRYAYYHLNPMREVNTFKSNVKLLTYGDDNIANISSLIPWFNHTSVSEELAKIGVVYTMADKEAASVPYIPISACSFLKRTWRYEPELGLHVGPLDLKSVYRSLCVWVASKSITPEEQMIEIITAANAEFFSYGRESFIVNQSKLKRIVQSNNLVQYVNENTFLSFDELIKRHQKASH